MKNIDYDNEYYGNKDSHGLTITEYKAAIRYPLSELTLKAFFFQPRQAKK